jgi:predicted lipoprotein with Yx(FWY)xxD motif
MNQPGAANVFSVRSNWEVIMSGSTFTIRLLGATAAVLLASACGSTTATPGTGASPTSAATSGGALGVRTTSLGPVVVDAKGFTVYLLTADRPGHSSCSAQCLVYWPLVPAPAGTTVPSVTGINAALAETKAISGASMVTAAGWPLYTFVKDKAPGDVTGQGVKAFGGTWYAVSPSGAAITAHAASAPTPSGSASTSTGARGGYGY